MEIAPPASAAGMGFCACVNHPEVEGDRTCGRCGQPYCPDCLVPLRGLLLCGRCKPYFLRDLQRRKTTDGQAQEALTYSLAGLVICGPLLESIALHKGISALRRHREDPTWPDRWKAVTAVVISTILMLLYMVWIALVLGSAE